MAWPQRNTNPFHDGNGFYHKTLQLIWRIILLSTFCFVFNKPFSCVHCPVSLLSPFLLNWSLWLSETERKVSVIFFLFAQNEWKEERCDSLRAWISDSNSQAQACHELGQPHWYSLFFFIYFLGSSLFNVWWVFFRICVCFSATQNGLWYFFYYVLLYLSATRFWVYCCASFCYLSFCFNMQQVC